MARTETCETGNGSGTAHGPHRDLWDRERVWHRSWSAHRPVRRGTGLAPLMASTQTCETGNGSGTAHCPLLCPPPSTETLQKVTQQH
ncbi:hypothetical protein ACOMHN_066891 [Nucella lapillus]